MHKRNVAIFWDHSRLCGECNQMSQKWTFYCTLFQKSQDFKTSASVKCKYRLCNKWLKELCSLSAIAFSNEQYCVLLGVGGSDVGGSKMCIHEICTYAHTNLEYGCNMKIKL